ncbi:MAG: hypothetical protein LDL31_13715, partial [Prosthecobacter sp.]|nr:hypothetical protein [Prosthecobacter sp.]
MRARSLNLYTRILLWLLVNVIVLGAGFWLVLQWQFREGVQGVLGGVIGDRLQNIGREVHARLASLPRTEWDGMLR